MTRFAWRTTAALAWSMMLMLGCACAADPGQAGPNVTPSDPGSAPAVTAAPGDSRLPDGTYRTPQLTRAELMTAGKRAGLSPAQVQEVLDRESIAETAAFALKVDNGQWTQFSSYDRGAEAIGFRATYEVVDDDTVVTTEECCGRSTFSYTLDGDSLRISWVRDEVVADRQACLDDAECPGGLVVWESAPFSRI